MDVVTAVEGERIKEEVTRRLRAEAESQEWSIPNVWNCVRESKREIVVVCPAVRETQPGFYVIQGIRAFLGQEIPCNSDYQGFVADQTGVEKTCLIPNDNTGNDNGFGGYQKVKEVMGKRWEIGVDPDQVEKGVGSGGFL